MSAFPSEGVVPLLEAVTWLAYGDAMDEEAYHEFCAPEANRESDLAKFEQAVDKFFTAARDKMIEIVGQKAANWDDSAIPRKFKDPMIIPPQMFQLPLHFGPTWPFPIFGGPGSTIGFSWFHPTVRVEHARFVKEGTLVPLSTGPAQVPKRQGAAGPRVKKAIQDVFGATGCPDRAVLSNGALVRKLNDHLAKTGGQTVSESTILRLTGRRKK